MRISLQEVKQIAENFLDILNKEKINTIRDIEKRKKLGEGALSTTLPNHFVRFRYVVSDVSAMVAVGYGIEQLGLVIELRVDPFMGNSFLVLKCADHVDDYHVEQDDLKRPVYIDEEGNYIQHKTFHRLPRIAKLKEELERITYLT